LAEPIETKRRLAAIFAADVEGYSRLMGADEVATLDALTARREILDGLIASHGGRIANTAGDSVLAEFGSAVDAVRCAMEALGALANANSTLPEGRRINFRIGVHVGDVMVRAGDLFGDGVNIAARLQTLAKAGGLCISGVTYDQVRKILPLEFTDLGAQTVKNIEEAVRAYEVRAQGEAASSASKDVSFLGDPKPLPLPDKPSIAVLPFQNMSGDPEQEYFADGMAEDIITALSRFRSLFVIARNSSFTYKGKAVDIKQVGRELGVRYVLEGSVRKAGNRVRITGQLIEAATDRHLWADKFDGPLEDVFGLQDQVTSSVVGLIAPKLEQAEIERARQKPTASLDSYDFFLRGMALAYRKGKLAEAREFFSKAFEQDPDYGAAYAMAASTLMWQQGTTGVPLTAEMRADATRLAHVGSRVGSDDAVALARSGHVLTYIGCEYDRGASMVEQAVALNPNLAIAWYSRGWVALMCGEAERAIESFERMIRLSPLDRLKVSAWNGSSFAHFCLRHYEDGWASAMQTIQVTKDAHTLGAYIVNAIHAGRTMEAKEAVAELLKLQPDFRASHSVQMFPMRILENRDRIIAALREAGVPE
jgi:TolB-like protein/class 3 adenylate cyclase/Tfp pilus assembly protein PilF